MSLRAILWVMNDAPVDNQTELAILYALADRASDDGSTAWPSQEWIAHRARCTARTVRTHLKNMEERGLIKRGNPKFVEHIRKDVRPIVWDLNLSLKRPENDDRKILPPGSPASNDRKTGAERPEAQRRTTGNRFPTNRPEPSLNHPEPKGGETSARKQGHRLPENWTPPKDVWDDVAQKCPNVDLNEEHENFTDYWLSKTGKDATKLDWSRTWRSWMRRSEKWAKQKGGRTPSVDEVLSWNVAHSMNENQEVPF